MDKTNSQVNLIATISTLLVLMFCYWSRIGLESILKPINYIATLALAITIFSLPDFVIIYLKTNKWSLSVAALNIICILFLAFWGFIFSLLSIKIYYLIIIIGAALFIWQLWNFFKIKKILTVVYGILVLSLLGIYGYSIGNHSPVFIEKVVLGLAHKDTLFHIAISNLFNTLGYITTGIDAAPVIKYHAGSHMLFSGLTYWTGSTVQVFYNIAYIAIFLPLFFKAVFQLALKYSDFIKEKSSLLVALTIIGLLYFNDIMGFSLFQPISSESLGVSIIFSLFYLSMLFSYPKQKKVDTTLFIVTVVLLTLICIFKISTGIIMCAAIAYLYLRKEPRIFTLLKITVGGLIILIIAYKTGISSVPLGKVGIDMRLKNLWRYSQGISYLIGLLVFLFVVFKNERIKSIADFVAIIKSNKYLTLELFAVASVVGFLFASYLSGDASDVFQFSFVHMVLIIPVLIAYSSKYFYSFKASNTLKSLLFVFIFGLSAFSTAWIAYSFVDVINTKKLYGNLSEDQKVLNELIFDLKKLNKVDNKDKLCVYIPHTEHWFYKSSEIYKTGIPFIVPAFSGVSLLNGITAEMANFNRYTYYAYKNEAYNFTTKVEMIEYAKNNNYKKLIIYKKENSKLVKEEISLLGK